MIFSSIELIWLGYNRPNRFENRARFFGSGLSLNLPKRLGQNPPWHFANVHPKCTFVTQIFLQIVLASVEQSQCHSDLYSPLLHVSLLIQRKTTQVEINCFLQTNTKQI